MNTRTFVLAAAVMLAMPAAATTGGTAPSAANTLLNTYMVAKVNPASAVGKANVSLTTQTGSCDLQGCVAGPAPSLAAAMSSGKPTISGTYSLTNWSSGWRYQDIGVHDLCVVTTANENNNNDTWAGVQPVGGRWRLAINNASVTATCYNF